MQRRLSILQVHTFDSRITTHDGTVKRVIILNDGVKDDPLAISSRTDRECRDPITKSSGAYRTDGRVIKR